MRERELDRPPRGFVGNESDEILHVGIAPRGREAAGNDVLGVELLHRLHAPQQPLLEVHHLAGVSEKARQPGIGALELALTLAEIAALERDVVGAALAAPQLLAAVDGEVSGVRERIAQHLAILLERLFRLLIRLRQGGSAERADNRDRRDQETPDERPRMELHRCPPGPALSPVSILDFRRRTGAGRAYMPAGFCEDYSAMIL